MDDPNAEKPSEDTQVNAENNTFVTDDLNESEVSVIHKESNENITWIALGIGVVDLVGIFAIVILLLVRNRAKRQGDVK